MLQIIYSEEMMIKINNLTKKYKEKYAVNNLNLEIKSGELFSLLGTNGAGKTTTIKMLSTLILPTSGEVKINNFDLTKDSAKIKEIINISPQETAIAPNLTVIENLYFSLQYKKPYSPKCSWVLPLAWPFMEPRCTLR